MFGFRNAQQEHMVEPAGVRLTYADTGLGFDARLGAVGMSYRRPTRVTVPESRSAIPIRDHVMVVRLAVIALLLVVSLWGRHDR
ncbi:MAG TPA: hypothetical protein VMS99_09935 [Acidimicrobiia bacterium]|nr:hypothetical protein [Acidimicrobiia bacterium]